MLSWKESSQHANLACLCSQPPRPLLRSPFWHCAARPCVIRIRKNAELEGVKSARVSRALSEPRFRTRRASTATATKTPNNGFEM